jgi:hypothetical protein
MRLVSLVTAFCPLQQNSVNQTPWNVQDDEKENNPIQVRCIILERPENQCYDNVYYRSHEEGFCSSGFPVELDLQISGKGRVRKELVHDALPEPVLRIGIVDESLQIAMRRR